ncbi:hypothetical protein WL39_15580 [Burkholderia ubonensis]|nr:hypothetical protein WL39_15580 [Burkholderia ubonensis]
MSDARFGQCLDAAHIYEPAGARRTRGLRDAKRPFNVGLAIRGERIAALIAHHMHARRQMHDGVAANTSRPSRAEIGEIIYLERQRPHLLR